MFKRVMLAGLLLGSSILGFAGNEVEATEKPKTFFMINHPDDEILSMGVGIFNHVWQDTTEVHLVLLSQGEHTGVFEILNGEKYCRVHKAYHDPHEEGYHMDTREDMKEARTNEFMYSALLLGVKPENIHINDLGDGNTTVKEVKGLIDELSAKYPGARFKSFSMFDYHSDHANAGKALQQAYDEGEVKDARFYVKNDQWLNNPETYPVDVKYEKFNKQYQPFIEAAAASYGRWSPKTQNLGVGDHSVPGSFDMLVEKPFSAYHLPLKKGAKY